MHIITKAMKLFSLPLICLIILPSLFAYQEHKQNDAYTHPAFVVSGGVSYISVQNVPAGKDISSTEYWIPLLDTAPPEDKPTTEAPTTEPDTSDSDLINLEPPEDNATQVEGIVRLSGISTRGPISLNNKMTGGILIEGNEDKKVVFMAKGYSMYVSDEVENYAEDLVMVIYSWNDSDEKWEYQGEYDDWGDVTNSTTESGSIVENISTIETSKNPEITLLQDDKEAGVVLTLPPGYHAAIVSSKSSSLQEAIVEAYEVK
ncbi:hypothetical protein N9N55_08055 [Opitutales bacterium]|nr:hypothetical protein [Opitutales bacterium]